MSTTLEIGYRDYLPSGDLSAAYSQLIMTPSYTQYMWKRLQFSSVISEGSLTLSDYERFFANLQIVCINDASGLINRIGVQKRKMLVEGIQQIHTQYANTVEYYIQFFDLLCQTSSESDSMDTSDTLKVPIYYEHLMPGGVNPSESELYGSLTQLLKEAACSPELITLIHNVGERCNNQLNAFFMAFNTLLIDQANELIEQLCDSNNLPTARRLVQHIRQSREGYKHSHLYYLKVAEGILQAETSLVSGAHSRNKKRKA